MLASLFITRHCRQTDDRVPASAQTTEGSPSFLSSMPICSTQSSSGPITPYHPLKIFAPLESKFLEHFDVFLVIVELRLHSSRTGDALQKLDHEWTCIIRWTCIHHQREVEAERLPRVVGRFHSAYKRTRISDGRRYAIMDLPVMVLKHATSEAH